MIIIKIKPIKTDALRKRLKNNFISPYFTNLVQTEVVDSQIKKMISVGLSPVKGKRRFAKYKNKETYPGKLKPSRPVNLKLTGEMLKNYIIEKSGQLSFKLGISRNAPPEVKEYAQANNEGTRYIAARRFVPLNGETYAVTIMRKIKDLTAKRIARLINM